MKRIQSAQASKAYQLFENLFLLASSNPVSLQYLILLMQALIFSVFVSSQSMDIGQVQAYLLQVPEWVWLTILVGLLFLRLIFGLVLIRMIYMLQIFVVMTLRKSFTEKIIICIFIKIHLLIDVLSHTQLQFFSINPHAETHNFNKLLHYCGFVICTILHFAPATFPHIFPPNIDFIPHLISAVCLTIITITKIPSQNNQPFAKQLILRFYLLSICFFLRNMIFSWANIDQNKIAKIYQNIIVIIISQLICTVAKWKYSIIPAQGEISNGNYVRLVYTMMCYLYGNHYDEGMESVLIQFIDEGNSKKKNQQNPIKDKNQKYISQQVQGANFASTNSQRMQKSTKILKTNSKQSKRLNSVLYEPTSNLSKQSSTGHPQLFSSFISSYGNQMNRKPNYLKFTLIDQFNEGCVLKYVVSERAERLLRQAHKQKIDDAFKCQFLLAQFRFVVHGDLIGAKLLLQKLKESSSTFSLIQKVCINKFDKKIQAKIQQKYKTTQILHFSQFFFNQQLRTMLIKHSYQYIQLWNYLSAPNILFKKLSKMLTKLIKHEQQIDQLYFQTTNNNIGSVENQQEESSICVDIKSKTMMIMFTDYLYMVRRDVDRSLKIFRSFEIFQQQYQSLAEENKIYLCIAIQQKYNLIIRNVGFNIKRLLGYQRHVIKNSSVSILLPNFFAESHQKLLIQSLTQTKLEFFIFTKSLIVKHFDNYYLPAFLRLKLVYDNEGSLFMQGYIQILQDPTYNWPNYFFVKTDDEEIVQVGPSLQETIDLNPRKFVHCRDFFESQKCSTHDIKTQYLSGKKFKQSANSDPKTQVKKKFMFHNGFEYEYELGRVFQYKGQQHEYYVCKNNTMELNSQFNMFHGNQKRIQDYLTQYLKYQKYPIKYEDFQTNLQQYFIAKQSTCNTISSNYPLRIFIAVVFLLLSGSAIQGVLIKGVQNTKESNQIMKNDMDNLIEFYHHLQNAGIFVDSYSISVRRGQNFSYQYYDLKQLCLMLQKQNEYVSKFDLQVYGQTIANTLTYSKSYHQLICQLLSNLYLKFYIEDTEIQAISYDNIYKNFPYIWGTPLNDYLNVYMKQVNQTVASDTLLKMTLTITLAAMMIIVFVLILKIDNYKREYEYQSLNNISGINSGVIFANSINQFLRRSVGGVNEKDFMQKSSKTIIRKDSVQNNSRYDLGNTMSNMSARQNSVRGFFQQSMINPNTNRQYKEHKRQNSSIPLNTLEMRQKVQQDQYERKQQKIKPISKLFLFIWLLALIVILAIISIYLVTDQTSANVSLVKSVKNLLIILNKQISFSSTIISYLDLYSSMNSTSPPNSSLFYLTYNRYYQLQGELPVFDELNFPQFSNFTSMFQDFNYQYICSYMQCDGRYQSYINIIYNSALERFNSYMVNYVNSSSKVNSTFATFQIQILLHGHYLLQKATYTLLKSYISDYTNYAVDKYTKTYIFYYCLIIAFVLFGAIGVGFYCIHFRKQVAKYLAILNLIKKQSYQLSTNNVQI